MSASLTKMFEHLTNMVSDTVQLFAPPVSALLKYFFENSKHRNAIIFVGFVIDLIIIAIVIYAFYVYINRE